MVKSFYTNIINPNLGTDSPSSNVTNPMSAILDMGGNSIINTAQATQSNAIPTLAQVQSLIGSGGGGGGFVPIATTNLNMNNFAIQGANYIGFENQDSSSSILANDLYIATDYINNKNVLTVSAGAGTDVGVIYDTVYNPLPASGGGWVPTATSDLNMATHSITGVGGISTASITVPYNEIYSVNTALAITRDGGTNVGYIYDSHYNPPSGNLDNLTIVDGKLEYNNEIVLTAQSGTTYVETLSLDEGFYSSGSILLPVSGVPAVNATTFTLTGGMTFNSSTNSLVGNSATSTATSKFKFVNGSALSWSSVSGVGCNLGFYDINANNPSQPCFSIGLINANGGVTVQLQWTAVAQEYGTFYGPVISGLNTSLTMTYVNNIFQVFIGGVLLQSFSSNGPNANLPISFTDNLVLQAFFTAPAGVSITQPSMSLSEVYVHPPYQTRGFTYLQQTSNNKPNVANSYLFNFKIPLNQTSSAIPFNGANPSINTRLDIFILDSTNTSIIANNPCWTFVFPTASPYMTWDTTSSFLTFNYQSDAQNPINTASIVENYYLLPWTQQTLTAPYTYYYVLTFTNQAYLLSDTIASPLPQTVVSNTSGNVYTYALCSEFDGTKTNISVGNNNEKMLTIKASDNTIKYGTDTVITSSNVSQFVTSSIAGLIVDPISHLLEYNTYPIMLNQYMVAGQVVAMTSTVSNNFSLNSATTPIGSLTVSGNFSDLFSTEYPYTFNVQMASTDPSTHFPPYNDLLSQTKMYIYIADSTGASILLNPSAGQPCFTDSSDFSFSNGILTFSATLNSASVPVSGDFYYFYTQGFRANCVGPYTITYAIVSQYRVGQTSGFSTINSVNTCTITLKGQDTSNPCPVVSNTSGSGIVTIRTAPTGPIIKCLPEGGGMIFFTDAMNIIPAGSNNAPKIIHAVKYGTYNGVGGSTLNIPVYPYAYDNFWYKWTLFITNATGTPFGFTYTENGYGVPASSSTGALFGRSASVVNSFGLSNLPTVLVTSMPINALYIAVINFPYNYIWTLEVDIMSS